MSEIIAAVDESAANSLIDTAISLIPPQSASGSGNLGPFIANYGVSARLVNGDIEMMTIKSFKQKLFDIGQNTDKNIGLN